MVNEEQRRGEEGGGHSILQMRGNRQDVTPQTGDWFWISESKEVIIIIIIIIIFRN